MNWCVPIAIRRKLPTSRPELSRCAWLERFTHDRPPRRSDKWSFPVLGKPLLFARSGRIGIARSLPDSSRQALALIRLDRQELPERLRSTGPTQAVERLFEVAPTVTIVLPVELRLPVVGRVHVKARDRHLRDRRVERARAIRGFIRVYVDALGHVESNGDLSDETGLFLQFPLSRLHHCLSRIDSAGDDVPITAVLRRSVHDQDFGIALASHEHRHLGSSPHRQKAGRYRLRRAVDVRAGRTLVSRSSSTVTEENVDWSTRRDR
jgi:hypothetical protein